MTILSVIWDEALALQLGKKGTLSDVTFYNFKRSDAVHTFIHPHMYPEKLSSLLTAIGLGTGCVLKVDSLTGDFAEAVIALDAMGIQGGILCISPGVPEESVNQLIKGTVVEKYRRLPAKSGDILDYIENGLDLKPAMPDAGSAVLIDHSFPVKGVGCVALGTVISGKVAKHQKLRAVPHDAAAEIRSIQMHDVDVNEAFVGSRVGLALKGVSPEDVPRGVILSADGTAKAVQDIDAPMVKNRFCRDIPGKGKPIHVWSRVTQAVATVEGSLTGDVAKLRLERKMACIPGDRLLLLNLNASGGSRIIGHISI